MNKHTGPESNVTIFVLFTNPDAACILHIKVKENGEGSEKDFQSVRSVILKEFDYEITPQGILQLVSK